MASSITRRPWSELLKAMLRRDYCCYKSAWSRVSSADLLPGYLRKLRHVYSGSVPGGRICSIASMAPGSSRIGREIGFADRI